MYQNAKTNSYHIGDVYQMQFDGVGSEQSGWRPGVVLQNDIGNRHSPNLIALPLTSAKKNEKQPTHIKISAANSGLPRDSIVLCENPERMSKERVGKYIATLSDDYMKDIAVGSLLATGVVAFLDIEALTQVRERAATMNMRTRRS